MHFKKPQQTTPEKKKIENGYQVERFIRVKSSYFNAWEMTAKSYKSHYYEPRNY